MDRRKTLLGIAAMLAIGMSTSRAEVAGNEALAAISDHPADAPVEMQHHHHRPRHHHHVQPRIHHHHVQPRVHHHARPRIHHHHRPRIHHHHRRH